MLNNCDIKCAGVKAAAAVLANSLLIHLELCHNKIKYGSIKTIAIELKNSPQTVLHIDNNDTIKSEEREHC